MIRSFVLFDLPTLHRYRHKGVFLDTTAALTWGPTVVPAGALLTHLAPATGIFTYLGGADKGADQLILAQVVHNNNSACARFSFLAPETALVSAAISQMVEYVAKQVGERGGHHLVAEVDEATQTYDVLRQNGFAIYARQRIWQFEELPDGEANRSSAWRSVSDHDEIGIRVLYNAVVPGLTQQVEEPPWENLRGLVLPQPDGLLAYVGLAYGPRGVMANPFFHPDTEEVQDRLEEILAGIPHRRGRPVYVVARSYQSWLEPALESLGAQPGDRQAVMVKRLTAAVKKPALSPLPALKGTTANPTVPFARTYQTTVGASKGE